MNNTARILIALLVSDPSPSSLPALSKFSGIAEDVALRLLWQMAQDTDPHGPLVTLSRDGVRIAGYMRHDSMAGGWAYLAECRDNVSLCEPVRPWKEEALTGITGSGKRSKITRAVLPTGSTVKQNRRAK